MILKDFTFTIPNGVNNIAFSSETKTITFKRIEINEDLMNVSFKFTNLKKVVIDQLTIKDITITDSVLFDLHGVDELYFSNVKIINTKFINSQLLMISNL